MKKIFLIVLLSLSYSSQVLSANFLLAIGAGGEPPKNDTIFDNAIINLATYVTNSPGLKADVAFNGGHAQTEKIVQKNFPSNVGKSGFFESDYSRLIQAYKMKLENNEMVAGDQLMVYINSHGAIKQDQFKSHSIATAASGATNIDTLSGATIVDLDQLQVLQKLAKDKGVKMAIIDLSCHSGNTLALADDNTCVISGTGPVHYSYSTFSENFTALMDKGKNLEEIFLKARSKDNSPSFPMISTPEGLATNSLIYDKLTPFLYRYESEHDKLTPYLASHATELQMYCANQNFTSLLGTINEIEVLNSNVSKSFWGFSTNKDVDLTKLKKLLFTYKKSLDAAKIKMQELNSSRLQNIETINASVGKFVLSLPVTWSDFLNSDYPKLISQMNVRISKEKDLSNRDSLMTTLSFYTQSEIKKNDILKANPDLANIQNKLKKITSLIDSNFDISARIGTEERKLYKALYSKSKLAQDPQEKNPCRDFRI
jgi:hypothetical protein